MKTFYAYTRVSTVKQGEQGVSLQAQREAIASYAKKHELAISSWYEEKETAAKRGRPVFGQMLTLLKAGKAVGVIIHKIDRSSRNLKDWADLGELIDQGIDVHFANEQLDLHSRGGRLSADIQAVVASDYIRNLREETRKGFYGRIRQGLYPLPAPLGYLDRGSGKAKEPDPKTAALVKKAFELYATGKYNLEGLVDELHRLGLRNRRGGRITINGLSVMLNNPFYIGLIRLKRTKETYPGAQQPLVSKAVFDRVQAILKGKFNIRVFRNAFLFRRLLACRGCGYSLIGEVQKGHTYYRCHSKNCPTTTVREESVEQVILEKIEPLQFTEQEREYLRQKVRRLKELWDGNLAEEIQAVRLKLTSLQERLNRLTDAFIDRLIEKDTFEQRKTDLLLEQKTLQEKLAGMQDEGKLVPDRLSQFLELAGSVYSSYQRALPDEKRDLLKVITSNRLVNGRNVAIELKNPFQLVANRTETSYGSPYRARPRTLDRLAKTLWNWLKANPDMDFAYPNGGEDGNKE